MPSFSYVVYGQDSVVFTNTSSEGNGWYSISFGDGNSFPGTPFSYWTSNSISHVYDTPGTYNVCLYDTFMNCTQSFFCDSITIPNCQANFTYWMSGVWCLADFTATGATSYNWDFGDCTQGSGSQINSHQFPSTATFNVCLYAIGAGGDTCDISCEQIFVDCGTDLTEYSQNKIQVYPNPTKGILTIEGMEGIAKVYDIYGRLVLAAKTNSLDISQAAPGIYFVRMLDEKGKIHTAKVFKE